MIHGKPECDEKRSSVKKKDRVRRTGPLQADIKRDEFERETYAAKYSGEQRPVPREQGRLAPEA